MGKQHQTSKKNIHVIHGENSSVEHSGGVSIVDWHLTGRDMDSAEMIQEELAFTLDRQMTGYETDLHSSTSSS